MAPDWLPPAIARLAGDSAAMPVWPDPEEPEEAEL
jgi:hypothetical protein